MSAVELILQPFLLDQRKADCIYLAWSEHVPPNVTFLLILLLEFLEIPIEKGFYKGNSIYELECQTDKIKEDAHFKIFNCVIQNQTHSHLQNIPCKRKMNK